MSSQAVVEKLLDGTSVRVVAETETEAAAFFAQVRQALRTAGAPFASASKTQLEVAAKGEVVRFECTTGSAGPRNEFTLTERVETHEMVQNIATDRNEDRVVKETLGVTIRM